MLTQLARNLAHSHQLAARPGRDRLPARLADNERGFQEAYDRLKRVAARARHGPSCGRLAPGKLQPSERVDALARRDLRTGHRRVLPYLCETGNGLPRVYDMAWELIAHLDAQIDQESLQEFFSAYQTVATLKLDELWSVCGMLRLGLIEYVCRVAIRVAPLEPVGSGLRPVPGRDAPGQAERDGARSLQNAPAGVEQDPHSGPLPEGKGSCEELSMKHSILSLRDLAMLDWKEFVERQSAVEQILREDPAGVYARMSFASRDHYRRIVQRLARHCPLDEVQVARAAIEHARKSAATTVGGVFVLFGRADVQRHVGYYLVDRGRTMLEAGIGFRPEWHTAVGRFFGRAPLASYLGALLLIWLLAVIAVAILGVKLEVVRIAGPAAALVLLAFFAGAAGQFAVRLVNLLCSLLVPPRPMMRLDFSAGIPAEYRTLVVVPALLASERTVRDLIEQLELRTWPTRTRICRSPC